MYDLFFLTISKNNFDMFFYFADNEFDDLEMQVVRYKPEGLDALCKNTKFTRKELQIMYRGFKQVSKHSYSCDMF